MYTVLVTDHPWMGLDVESETLASVSARLELADSGEEAELVARVRRADAILTCFSQVSRTVVRAGERLKVIARYGIGVDNIDVTEATRRGIIVTNTPSYCTDEVAEHALALMLSLLRRIPTYDRLVRSGEWSVGGGSPVHRIRGRTLGIVGFGQIGRALAVRARSLGMEVVAHSHSRECEGVGVLGTELVSLYELARRADAVSLHLPLTDATRGLISARFLRAMKPGAILINTARGAVVDEEALAEALRDGHLSGAGIDVFTPERPGPGHPLLNAPNVLVTPHVAYYSEESLVTLARTAAENIGAVLAGRVPAAVVNPRVLTLPRWRQLDGLVARDTARPTACTRAADFVDC